MAKGKKGNKQDPEHSLPSTTHDLRPIMVSRELCQQNIPVFKYLHTGTKPKDVSRGEIAPIELWILILRLVWYQNSLLFNPIQYPVPHSLNPLNLAIIPIIIHCNLIFQLIYLKDLLLDLLYLLEIKITTLIVQTSAFH